MAPSKLTNENKLRRLIYFGRVEHPKYISGNPEKRIIYNSKQKLELFTEFWKNSPKDFLRTVSSISRDKSLPHRSELFNVLALAFCQEITNEQMKSDICWTVLEICKSDKDFFDFIKYISTMRKTKTPKLPHAIWKTAAKYYQNKSAEQLAKSFILSKSYHKWSHKDLIKLCHLKSDTPEKNVVVSYILFKKVNEQTDAEAKRLIDLMTKSETLRSTQDPLEALPLIKQLKATINQVDPSLRKSMQVWSATLPNMHLSDVIQVLPKLYKLGFLKKDTPVLARVTEALTTPEKVKTSRVHPIEVFIGLKNFEKGGKPLDPKLIDHIKKENDLSEAEIVKLKTPLEVKCPIVISNLQKCMSLACNSVQQTGKRYLITIDTTEKMDMACLSKRNVNAIEAAVAFAWCFLRIEKDVTVAVFKERQIQIVQLDKRGYIFEYIQKVKEIKSKYLVVTSPIEWSMSQKKHIDIFLNFINHKDYHLAIPKELKERLHRPSEILLKYKKKVNLPNARMVNVCFTSPHVNFSDGSSNILDVAGLDVGVPKIIDAFCRNNLH